MTVEQLIYILQTLPKGCEKLHVYAEGEPANKVIVEDYKGVPQIVRIFKAWDIEFVDSPTFER